MLFVNSQHKFFVILYGFCSLAKFLVDFLNSSPSSGLMKLVDVELHLQLHWDCLGTAGGWPSIPVLSALSPHPQHDFMDQKQMKERQRKGPQASPLTPQTLARKPRIREGGRPRRRDSCTQNPLSTKFPAFRVSNKSCSLPLTAVCLRRCRWVHCVANCLA